MKELVLDDTITQLTGGQGQNAKPSPRNVKPNISALDASGGASPAVTPSARRQTDIDSPAGIKPGETFNVSKREAVDEEREDDSSSTDPHPCGIVCTRLDYFTIPALDKLVDYMDGNCDCFVENFSVGREGYGSLFFPGVTNVANLDIDSIGTCLVIRSI